MKYIWRIDINRVPWWSFHIAVCICRIMFYETNILVCYIIMGHNHNMEWLWLVGSFKILVSFAERDLHYIMMCHNHNMGWLWLVVSIKYWSLLQNIVSFLRLFCKRDLCHIIMCHNHDMGWLWLVGSLKILVSFAEYSLFSGAFLQKRPMFLGRLLIVATS